MSACRCKFVPMPGWTPVPGKVEPCEWHESLEATVKEMLLAFGSLLRVVRRLQIREIDEIAQAADELQ